MANKQYKQFPLDTIEEGLQALSSLIASVMANLSKYNEYRSEIELLLKKYENVADQENEIDEIFIPAKEYDDINDKLLYRQREILKYIADHQSSSFSYINLREYLLKRKYLTKDLDEKTNQLLKELLEIRNWTFHNPQSMLVAAKETATKGIPKELLGMATVIPQLNPIIIDNITHYDILMLITLVGHTHKRAEQFETVLEHMKSDYIEMYETIPNRPFHFVDGKLSDEIYFHTLNRISRLESVSSDISQLSMGIQKSKYNGSNDSFEEWTVTRHDD